MGAILDEFLQRLDTDTLCSVKPDLEKVKTKNSTEFPTQKAMLSYNPGPPLKPEGKES